ncbi:MAG: hypothetical protein Fur0041_18970 [Bacteroidia bacterium]
MKKQLLTIATLAIGISASAQITITSADLALIYSQVIQIQDTTPTVTEGSAGANQTWNFTALNNQNPDTLLFTLPQFTPFGPQIPACNFAAEVNNGQAYLYFNLNSSVFEVVAQAADPFGTGAFVNGFQNPETNLVFPATYNTTFSDTAKGMAQFYLGIDPGIGFVIDSVRLHTTITKNSVFDAWGSATTPLGTYNVLRQNTFRKQIDTIDIYAFGQWAPGFFSQEDSLRTYTFLANSVGFPLVELELQDDLGTVTNARWIAANPTPNVGIAENNNNATSVFPNPAADVLNIQCNVSSGRVEILDVNGRLISTHTFNSNIITLNVAELNAGTYFYSVIGSDNSVSRGRFAVAH